MNVDQMIEKKREYGYSNEKIAKLSGIPLSTVQKIFSGETKSPRYDTVRAISAIFEKVERGFADEIREIGTAYQAISQGTMKSIKEYGEKTISDYLALPEGARVEMIDGVFYDMASPTTIHQRIASIVFSFIYNYIDSNKGRCIPFIAPTDVQLDNDDKTMVQPDVLVVCDKNKITKTRVVGAPDFIVEVLSPSNYLMDMIVKLKKYKQSGVREYWIILPDQERVIVYNFEKSDMPDQFTFEDKVPVNIWNGKCKIDFVKIKEKIQEMLS